MISLRHLTLERSFREPKGDLLDGEPSSGWVKSKYEFLSSTDVPKLWVEFNYRVKWGYAVCCQNTRWFLVLEWSPNSLTFSRWLLRRLRNLSHQQQPSSLQGFTPQDDQIPPKYINQSLNVNYRARYDAKQVNEAQTGTRSQLRLRFRVLITRR